MNDVYASIEPSRREIDLLAGPAVVEFGTPWRGYCREGKEIARLVRPAGADEIREALEQIDAG